MEEASRDLNIEDYSVSQNMLDNVSPVLYNAVLMVQTPVDRDIIAQKRFGGFGF